MSTRDNLYYPTSDQSINSHQDDDRLRFFYETRAQLLALSIEAGTDISFSDLEALEEDFK